MKISSRNAWQIVTFVVLGLEAVCGIVAGKYAKEGDYPFAIVILKEEKVICGGVLVTREHVFTGCHCVGSWKEASESSTVGWEPDQTAYDFNFSTTDSADRNVRVGGRRHFQTKTTTEHTLGFIEVSTVGRSTPNSHDQSGSSFNLLTGRALRSATANKKFLITSSATTATRRLERRQISSSTGPTTVLTTADDSTSNDSSNGPLLAGNTTTPTKMGKFNPFALTEVYMVAGTVWIYKFSRGQLRRAGNSFKHPRCTAKTVPWDYDFGIYRANSPFQLDEMRLYPMRIYHNDNEIFRRKFQSMIEGGAMCQTIGWGATQLLDGSDNPYHNTFNRTGVNMSETLKHTDVKLVTDELCNELLCFPPYNFCNGSDFQWSEVGIVCAIHVSRGDSCDIDDGNALVCDGHVFGFANSGLDCLANIPRFYTRLDYALDFYYSSVNLGTPRYLMSLLTTVTAVVLIFIKRST